MKDVLAAAFFVALVGLPAHAQAGCPDPMSVLHAFYAANDAGRFDAGMQYVADDIVFDTWATGVNGHQMVKRHLAGKRALRKFISEARGLQHRLPGSPADGPVYRETRLVVQGHEVRFMLEPDRKRPDGKLYNSFRVEAAVEGCRIRALTVIEQITWL